MSVKPYRIIARIKNNRLWQAILVLYPDVKTQADASRVLDMTQQDLGQYINLKRWPGRIVKGEIRWAKVAIKLSRALAYEPEYLFDPELYGVNAVQAPKLIELEAG